MVLYRKDSCQGSKLQGLVSPSRPFRFWGLFERLWGQQMSLNSRVKWFSPVRKWTMTS